VNVTAPSAIEQAMQTALGHHQSGRLAEAEALYRQVLASDPNHAGALHLLGVLAGQGGDPDRAIELIGRAVALDPSVPGYHNNLGEFSSRTGQFDAAIACFRRAIALKPAMAVAQANLARALRAAGRLDEAINAYHRLVELQPNSAEACNDLGIALYDAGRRDEAIDAYRRAIAVSPADASAHNNLGTALYHAGRVDEAVATLCRAIELDPGFAPAFTNLGNVRLGQGRTDDALASYRKAIELQGGSGDAWHNLLFAIHLDPAHDAPAIRAEHERWAARVAVPLAAEIRPHANDRTPGRKLRIGFVSPDLRDHPIGVMMQPVLEHHQPAQASYICYSDVRAPDAVTARLERLADGWHRTTGLSDADLAERIRGDQVDILVDLSLHSAGNRMRVFARQPAPVQATMLGYPSTTGLKAIVYRLTDSYLDPPGATDSDYTEQSLRLPHSFWVFVPPVESPPVNPLPAQRRGWITFGYLNQFARITHPARQLWARILRAVPRSFLKIQAPMGSYLAETCAAFEEEGVSADRLEFVRRVPRSDYLARFQRLDLCLDPFPYNGHTSTFDALWMGVPVITLAGRTAVGRAGLSILSNLGRTEFVARSPEEYVAIAVAAATDLDRLAELRGSLRQRLLGSPIADGRRYAADVDSALRQMWQSWCLQ
jgi:predicted O-linked N-acetylglucosamine transferase (SPINDLY family)